MLKYTFLTLLLVPIALFAQQYELKPLSDNVPARIRGLSIVNEKVIWASGTNGYIGKSTTGGETWQWQQVRGFEKLDFRDIQAFDSLNVVIINAGSPAYVFYSSDGGNTWTESYKNNHPEIFLDGMDFWNRQRGMIFGDPIGDRMQLLQTLDGGKSWQDISNQLPIKLAKGEAGFAASGSSIKTLGNGKVWIATGGTVSNIYHSTDYGKTWNQSPLPMLQGESSQGAFSIDFVSSQNGIVVGGDYKSDKRNDQNCVISNDGGTSWITPQSPLTGYRSSVIFVDKQFCVATGTSGTDISLDGGKNWSQISSDSFNVVKAFANWIVLAGDNGKIVSFNK